MILLLVWLGVCFAEMRVSAANFGTQFNGYGAIPNVRRRVAPAPMRYRVLAACLLGGIPEPARIYAYILFKWSCILVALLASLPVVGLAGVFVLAGLMATTLEYDYWDSYVELAGVALCLYGNPLAAVVGAALWGMSKETVLIAPIVAGLAGGWLCGLAALAGPAILGFVRWRQGKAALYCVRWTFVKMNLPDVRAMWTRKDKGAALSVLWAVAIVLVSASGNLSGALAATRWLPLCWVVAGWVLARARETRIFLPAALWLAGSIQSEV